MIWYWFLSISIAHALPSPVLVQPGRVTPPVQSGALIGGQAGDVLSLLGISHSKLDKASERLTLSYGDRDGKPLTAEPGYFHVTVDRNAQRVVIDLAQVARTAVDPQQLKRILASSKLISGSEMTMDPYDRSTNITLSLKSPSRIKAVASESEPGKLVLEIEPIREPISAGAKP